MPKYQEYFYEMLEIHKELFEKFQTIHDNYEQDPKAYQEELNDVGEDVLITVRRFESMLCDKSEGTGYGKFSQNLSDKFWSAVRAKFPKIDYVGLK